MDQHLDDDGDQFYASMVMMASNYKSIRKQGNGPANPAPVKKAKAGQKRNTGNNKQRSSSQLLSLPPSECSAQNSPPAPVLTRYAMESAGVSEMIQPTYASSLNDLGGYGDFACSPTHVDITFADPPVLTTVSKDGSLSYRHNPYSRSVSTIVVSESHSLCASSIRSASCNSVDSYHPSAPCSPFYMDPSETNMYRTPTAEARPQKVGPMGTLDLNSVMNNNGHSSSNTNCNQLNGNAATINTNNNGATDIREQFECIADRIEEEACTPRGRQLLVHVLRSRDFDMVGKAVESLLPHANTIALDPNGCHVMRALVEHLALQEVLLFVQALHPTTIFRLCTSSQHTRRVIQAIFETHQSVELNGLVNVLANDACRLSMTQQGCIVIMTVFSHALVEQKLRVLPYLMPLLSALATDQYGNYVVQTMIEHHEGIVSIEELNAALGKYRIPHSCHKCASNVMEKLVTYATGATRRQIVQEFIFDPMHCHTLLQDCYGNFVLQAIIKSSSDEAEFRVIYDTIITHLPNSPYGQKIGGKLHEKYKAVFHTDPPATHTTGPSTRHNNNRKPIHE